MQIEPELPAVGHVEYLEDGTATFTQRDGWLVDRERARDGMTGHAKECEMSKERLKPGDMKVITGKRLL